MLRKRGRLTMNADWTKNPGLSGIDPAKLAMLQSLASQGSGKKQNELLPFLMAAASTAKQEGKQFTAEEMDLIAEVLKSGKTPEETAQIDKMMHLMKNVKKAVLIPGPAPGRPPPPGSGSLPGCHEGAVPSPGRFPRPRSPHRPIPPAFPLFLPRALPGP